MNFPKVRISAVRRDFFVDYRYLRKGVNLFTVGGGDAKKHAKMAVGQGAREKIQATGSTKHTTNERGEKEYTHQAAQTARAETSY